MLLRSNRQGRELLVVVLNLQGGTVSHKGAVRQTDTQRGADLGAFDSVRVVVLAVNVTGDYKVVLKNFESLSRNHINSKKCISHESVSKKMLAVTRFPLLNLSLTLALDPL